MKEKIQQGGAICRDCAIENNAKVPENHLGCTWWTDKCIICEEKTSCCCTTDWDWPFWKPSFMEREI